MLVAAVAILTAGRGLSAQQYSRDPEPFRGNDEIRGRTDFQYNGMSFLHRFAYRFRPAMVRAWDTTRQGYRGAAGSTRSSEFYVVQEFRKVFDLDGPLFFSFQHKRDEDFDDQYDRTVIGIGVELSKNWSVGVFGEVLPDKEDDDLQVEVNWEGERGRLRVAAVAVDMLFNTKTDDQRYTTRPFTFFGEGVWAGPGGLQLATWVNYNSSLRLERLQEGFAFTYEQLTGGLTAFKPLSDSWLIDAAFRGEWGERGFDAIDSSFTDERDFKRRSIDTNVELTHLFTDRVSAWLGARYFWLSERQTPRPPPDGDIVRRERMIYGGMGWKLGERFLLWPSIYLNDLNNRGGAVTMGREGKKTGFVGKLAVTLDVVFNDDGSFVMSTGPSLLLHHWRFGGYVMHIQLPL